MTSDSNPPDMPDQPSGMPPQPAPDPTPEASPVTDAMADAKAAFSRAGFSTPTGMIALAGLIILGVELVFNIIMREFSTGPFLLPAIVIVVIYYGKGVYDRIGPADTLLKLVGMVLAVIAVVSLLITLRSASALLRDVSNILGYLLVWGAALLAFMGARSIE